MLPSGSPPQAENPASHVSKAAEKQPPSAHTYEKSGKELACKEKYMFGVDMEKRIEKEKVDINYEDTLEFFEHRGAKEKLEHRYNYVLFQDDNPQLAVERDRMEKEKIGKILWGNNAGKGEVLDIGCGVGRWGEEILQHGMSYVGVDYSRNLLEIAQENLEKINDNFALINAPFQNLIPALKDKGKYKKYDMIFINGVLMYLNDTDLGKALDDVGEFLKDSCTIYIKETVAVDNRLTLNKFYSDELKQDYSVIYRYVGDYTKLIEDKFIKPHKMEMYDSGDVFEESLKNRKETKDYYYILKR